MIPEGEESMMDRGVKARSSHVIRSWKLRAHTSTIIMSRGREGQREREKESECQVAVG